jgi:hypothetical protein
MPEQKFDYLGEIERVRRELVSFRDISLLAPLQAAGVAEFDSILQPSQYIQVTPPPSISGTDSGS